MKKFLKFVLGAASFAAIAGGVYYFIKGKSDKDEADNFDDFDDDFDDNLEEESEHSTESREYVTINIVPGESEEKNTDSEKKEEKPSQTEEVSSEAD